MVIAGVSEAVELVLGVVLRGCVEMVNEEVEVGSEEEARRGTFLVT